VASRSELGRTVALEHAAGEPVPAALLAGEGALHHDVALDGRRRGARDHEVDARGDRAAVGVRQGRLLPDDRRQVAVERVHEVLDVATERVAGGADGDAAGVDDALVEDRRVVEAEERVEAAVVEEADAANLVTQVRARVAATSGFTNAMFAMPNIPTFWYMFRRCGIFTSCVSFSNEVSPSEPKKPAAGFEHVAAVAGADGVGLGIGVERRSLDAEVEVASARRRRR
jgi:hypothetical protein